jgi:hypothetical protein
MVTTDGGHGSGVVLSQDGLVASHVVGKHRDVSRPARRPAARRPGARRRSHTDLAIRRSILQRPPIAALGGELRCGQIAIAIGNPLLQRPSPPVISPAEPPLAAGRPIEDDQTDAALNPAPGGAVSSPAGGQSARRSPGRNCFAVASNTVAGAGRNCSMAGTACYLGVAADTTCCAASPMPISQPFGRGAALDRQGRSGCPCRSARRRRAVAARRRPVEGPGPLLQLTADAIGQRVKLQLRWPAGQPRRRGLSWRGSWAEIRLAPARRQ